MVSVDAFRHNFDGYILNKVVPETFQGVKYDTTRPFNTDKGHLQGLEFAYRQFFDKLPGWLSGFGVEANYTYMEGGVTESGGASVESKTFPGLSKNAYNVVALYEKYGVSARLAYNWRSKFVQVYGDRPSNAGTTPAMDLIAAPMSTLDGSLSYKITPDLSITLTGTNLLNYKYVDYWNDQNLYPRDTRRYDRTIGLSLNWKH
jgi:TonB-dependent receptor